MPITQPGVDTELVTLKQDHHLAGGAPRGCRNPPARRALMLRTKGLPEAARFTKGTCSFPRKCFFFLFPTFKWAKRHTRHNKPALRQ